MSKNNVEILYNRLVNDGIVALVTKGNEYLFWEWLEWLEGKREDGGEAFNRIIAEGRRLA